MKNSPLLDRYKGLVSASLLMQIYEVAHELAGLHVLHVNTTAQGGGVAEILSDLLPQAEELGIRHDWKVISLDEASGYFTARLVDMLQGYDTGPFPEAEKQVFLEKLRHAVSQEPAYQADVYFIHDFQLVPLAEFFLWMRPAIWFWGRCTLPAPPGPSTAWSMYSRPSRCRKSGRWSASRCAASSASN